MNAGTSQLGIKYMRIFINKHIKNLFDLKTVRIFAEYSFRMQVHCLIFLIQK